MEHALDAHQTASTVSTLHIVRPVLAARNPTKVNVMITAPKTLTNKVLHVMTAPTHVRNASASTTAHNADSPTLCSKVNADSNAPQLIT